MRKLLLGFLLFCVLIGVIAYKAKLELESDGIEYPATCRDQFGRIIKCVR